MEMEMFPILFGCASVRNGNLSFRVKSREGGCNYEREEKKKWKTLALHIYIYVYVKFTEVNIISEPDADNFLVRV